MKKIKLENQISSALLGLAIGDALGVPVEFKSRSYLQENPVTDMIGFGTYNQPPGTFSDDSSMTFCLAENIANEYNLEDIANNFILWYTENYWTATNEMFDIGIATSEALDLIIKGESPKYSGGFDERSNGNGSLMRILPLAFFVKNKPINERYQIVREVSSITHAHIRSVIGCFYYVEFILLILKGNTRFEAYKILQTEIPNFLKEIQINPEEIKLYDRLLNQNIYELNKDEIQSTGYVIYTLEASIWCLLTTNSYQDAVLKAVNLGNDTDTVAAVTGGLAGLYYGIENIPKEWIETLARNKDIKNLASRMAVNLIS